MEVDDDRFVQGEVIVEIIWFELVLGSADGTIRKCSYANIANTQVGRFFLCKLDSFKCLDGRNIANTANDNVGIIVRGKLINGSAAICKLEPSVININPTRHFILVKCCKINNIFGARHKFPGSGRSDIINWE